MCGLMRLFLDCGEPSQGEVDPNMTSDTQALSCQNRVRFPLTDNCSKSLLDLGLTLLTRSLAVIGGMGWYPTRREACLTPGQLGPGWQL